MPTPFDWDEANLAHIAEHGVSAAEAEQVIFNDPVDLAVQLRGGEERVLQIGETDAGRVLLVVTTSRTGKIRVVTAFAANKRMRKVYEEQKDRSYKLERPNTEVRKRSRRGALVARESG